MDRFLQFSSSSVTHFIYGGALGGNKFIINGNNNSIYLLIKKMSLKNKLLSFNRIKLDLKLKLNHKLTQTTSNNFKKKWNPKLLNRPQFMTILITNIKCQK